LQPVDVVVRFVWNHSQNSSSVILRLRTLMPAYPILNYVSFFINV
jgi:hypothetical protein